MNDYYTKAIIEAHIKEIIFKWLGSLRPINKPCEETTRAEIEELAKEIGKFMRL